MTGPRLSIALACGVGAGLIFFGVSWLRGSDAPPTPPPIELRRFEPAPGPREPSAQPRRNGARPVDPPAAGGGSTGRPDNEDGDQDEDVDDDADEDDDEELDD